MRLLLYKLASFFYHLGTKCINLILLPFGKQYYSAQCYFPEYLDRRKSKFYILLDQYAHVLKYGRPNSFYFLYGLDIKGLNRSGDFVDCNLFIRRREKMNRRFCEYPPIGVLRDKSLFGVVAEGFGIRTPNNIGIIKNGIVYMFEKKCKMPLSEFIEQNDECDAFIKRIDGECGDGVFHIHISDGMIRYKNEQLNTDIFNKQDRYLIQDAIKGQHHDISIIYPKAINTLRLVTVLNPQTKDIEVMTCVLRVGKGENQVDNWAMGGLSIGVDLEKGTLRKYGFYKPGFGTKATEHPDSHVVFDGYKIPYLQEAINQAKTLHGHLYGIHSIGWDIAITEDGPCFVEGNDNWEISLMQISNHGLQKEFKQLFY